MTFWKVGGNHGIFKKALKMRPNELHSICTSEEVAIAICEKDWTVSHFWSANDVEMKLWKVVSLKKLSKEGSINFIAFLVPNL